MLENLAIYRNSFVEQTIANGTAVARANNFLTRSCESKKGLNNTSEIFDISKSQIASHARNRTYVRTFAPRVHMSDVQQFL